jgi:hypothetical protein
VVDLFQKIEPIDTDIKKIPSLKDDHFSHESRNFCAKNTKNEELIKKTNINVKSNFTDNKNIEDLTLELEYELKLQQFFKDWSCCLIEKKIEIT